MARVFKINLSLEDILFLNFLFLNFVLDLAL